MSVVAAQLQTNPDQPSVVQFAAEPQPAVFYKLVKQGWMTRSPVGKKAMFTTLGELLEACGAGADQANQER